MSSSCSPHPSRPSEETPADLARFEPLYALLLPWIIVRARRLSGGDRDLRDDLLQTALCALWELCRCGSAPFDVAGIQAHLYDEMLSYRRAERRAGVIGDPWERQPSRPTRHIAYVPRRASSTTRDAAAVVGKSPHVARTMHNASSDAS